MDKNNYFEKLYFNNGKKINVSRKIDLHFFDKMHWHPFVEILVCLCDNNEITINFTKYTMKTNDLVILCPGDLHSIRHTDENAFILVQFPMELLTTTSELNSIFNRLNRYHFIKYSSTNIELNEMILFIKQLPSLYNSNEPFSEVQTYIHLLKFFVKLGQYLIIENKEDYLNESIIEYKYTKLMTEACLFISQNCVKPLTLDDVCNHVGISKSHFSLLFKKYTNMTFIDFLTLERIKKAEFFISNPKVHITDIAFDSGFSSISSFNRAFKRIKGISPSEFRKTMINTTF